MKKIEELLSKKRVELDEIEVPEVLEARLKHALETRTTKNKKQRNWRIGAAVALLSLMLAGYHFDTLAYYGKKLMGYEGVMNGTLQKLNELGKGQVIGESYTFKNGIVITLDGIMLDENQLLAFYTIKDPGAQVDSMPFHPRFNMKGIGGNHRMQGGQGELNHEKTEIKWISHFEPPFFFEKTLDFEIEMMGENFREIGKITFTLDRSIAMGHQLKKSIGQSIEVDETKIQFDHILASPTRTVIKGSIQNIFDLAKDQLLGERFRPQHLEVKLIADGKEIERQSSGMSTDSRGMTFHMDYDALPLDLKKLELELVSFAADHDVKEQIDLVKGEENQVVEVLGQKISINKVYESKGDTYVTITTEEHTVLTRVFLLMEDRTIELKETTTDGYEKREDGTILHKRTLHFPGIGQGLKLDIQRMTYAKDYHQVLDIPVK